MDYQLALDRLPQVCQTTGYSRSHLYRAIKAGLFPPPVALTNTGSAVAFPRHEVQRIVAAKIAGLDDGKVRELVANLVAQRAHALEAVHAAS
jgi:predicted DNA-binding transcriptional regulator AlpA